VHVPEEIESLGIADRRARRDDGYWAALAHAPRGALPWPVINVIEPYQPMLGTRREMAPQSQHRIIGMAGKGEPDFATIVELVCSPASGSPVWRFASACNAR
jgi:hypothetical protein